MSELVNGTEESTYREVVSRCHRSILLEVLGRRIHLPRPVSGLADVQGQAQFLLYLADQIEESLEQLGSETDSCHGAFLCKVLGMYSSQLETKHRQGSETRSPKPAEEVYVTVREYDAN